MKKVLIYLTKSQQENDRREQKQKQKNNDRTNAVVTINPFCEKRRFFPTLKYIHAYPQPSAFFTTTTNNNCAEISELPSFLFLLHVICGQQLFKSAKIIAAKMMSDGMNETLPGWLSD